MSDPHVLPDSRLAHRPDLGTVMVDWPLPGGRAVRVEAQPVFCASCGSMYGYVPKDNTAFACYLCDQCYQQYGAIAGTYAVPDEEFAKAVGYEMERKFGRHLTDVELTVLAERGELGRELEALDRDSPYPVPSRRPKG